HHQVKLRNMNTGKLSENRYRSDEKIELVRVERIPFQYLYNDGDSYYFMNTGNYEQIPVPKEQIGEGIEFLKENEQVDIAFEGDIVLGVDVPLHVNLVVAHTEPGLRGDTATNVTKPATLETGAEVQVPLFINEGDKIRVDTRQGSYIERVKE
ncbi:MAG: elongation factor P, partial [Bacteroidota bacterium]